MFVGAIALGGCLSRASTPSGEASAEGTDACRSICRAGRSCSSISGQDCREKCGQLIAVRVRDGLAGAIADCAAPRIESACRDGRGDDGMSAALVKCIDETGRDELANDDAPMKVAARAICGREARCNSGTRRQERQCVEGVLEKSTTTDGFGFFGALRPELVDEFASCISDAECDEAGSTDPCFHRLVGISSDDAPARPKARPRTAPTPPTRPPPKAPPHGPKHEEAPDLRGTPI